MEKEKWLKRYKARMIKHGVNEEDAQIATDVAYVDIDDASIHDEDPENAADDEFSYWASDS